MDQELISDPFLALDKIAYYLGRRDHSKKELKTKLKSRFSLSAIEEAFEIAEERRWILPPDELAKKVASSLDQKRKGINYINNYLSDKGLPIVEKQPEIEKEKALSLLSSKFGKISKLSFEEKEKSYRYLANRGFDFETIRQVVNHSESEI